MSIRAGGCGATDLVYQSYFSRDGQGASPAALPAGVYGFAAEARDADCQWVGQGCTSLSLPEDGTDSVVVLVRELPASPACEPSACLGGSCAGDQSKDTAPTSMTGDESGPVPGPVDAGVADGPTDPVEPAPAEAGVSDPSPPLLCGDGEVGHSGACYRYDERLLSWLDAEADCVAWGGHLVTVENETEEQWVMETFTDNERFWIGYTDQGQEGQWRWLNDAPTGYENFGGMDPNGDTDENCGEFHKDHWHDSPCDEAKNAAFICERADAVRR